MNFAAAQLAIQGYLSTNVTTIPIHFQNNKFNPVKRYIRCSILFGDSEQISLGSNPDNRHPGVLILSIFEEQGQGSNPAMILADTLSALFDKKIVSGIQFRTPKLAILGETGSHYQVNVQCPFYFDNQS